MGRVLVKHCTLNLNEFICFLSAHSAVFGKSILTYNSNPSYGLAGTEATSFANFWQQSDYNPFHHHRRYKHHGNGRGHGNGYGGNKLKPNHPHFNRPQDFPDPFDYDSDEYEGPGYNHDFQHPGHGRPQHSHHPGHPQHPHYGYNQPAPPRFPPPPVYDKDFINPWIGVQTPPNQQRPQEMIPRPANPTTTAAPETSTSTIAPPTAIPTIESSTTNADGLIYDIDIRFGH